MVPNSREEALFERHNRQVALNEALDARSRASSFAGKVISSVQVRYSEYRLNVGQRWVEEQVWLPPAPSATGAAIGHLEAPPSPFLKDREM